MRLVLIGDVGDASTFHVGDEAMLEADVHLARDRFPEAELVVVTKDPQYTSERLGVEAARFVPRVPTDTTALENWTTHARLKVGDAAFSFQAGDVLWVTGGGNLTSTWPHLVAERLALSRAAADVGAALVLSGQSIGPDLHGPTGEGVRELLSHARGIGVRDPDSFALCRSLGLESVLFPDDALRLAQEESEGRNQEDVLLITVHPFADRGDPRMESLASQLRQVSHVSGLRLLFVPHVAGVEANGLSDVRVAEELAAATGGDIFDSLIPGEVASATRSATCVVSTRYHPLVWATSASKPALALPCDAYTRAKMMGALAMAGASTWSMWLESAVAGLLEPALLELVEARQAFRERSESVISHLAKLDVARRSWLTSVIEGSATKPIADEQRLVEIRPHGAWTLAVNPSHSTMPPMELLRERPAASPDATNAGPSPDGV